MDTIKPLFTATATRHRPARNGHYRIERTASCGPIYLCRRRWAVPDGRAPRRRRHLFAAGYAACFGGALDFVARSIERMLRRLGSRARCRSARARAAGSE
jgi:organic hydroperoxide reductase OsmC/OhrA